MEKLKNNFGLLLKSKDGLRPECKSCRGLVSARYREKNREKLRLQSARIRAEKPLEIKQRKLDDYNNNKEKHRKRAKEWRLRNPDYRPCPKSLKNAKLKKNFGITLNDYESMLANQNGVCAICGDVGTKALHVDHCHTSGKVRGLLCFRCNNGIGQFKESEKIMIAAIEYIKAYK
jgi:hypothetical protein